MVLINYAGREINAKIVYYGPGLSGKTTNLECIYASVPTPSRGKMVSMKTRQDRTLFFDFLPLELGEVHGFRTRFLLYTVPGQVFYNATRKLVLKGADAVVFVADSGLGKMPENQESLHNLEENLREQGLAIETLPFVIQYNKRDLPQLHSIEELEAALNPRRVPSFEAAAATGRGVYETLHAVSRLLFQRLMKDLRPGGSRPGAPATVGLPAALQPAAPVASGPNAPVRPAPPRTVPAPVTSGATRPAPVPAGVPTGAGTAVTSQGVEARQSAPARPAPPELLEPAPWQEGDSEAPFAADTLPGDLGLVLGSPGAGTAPERLGTLPARKGLFSTPASGQAATPAAEEVQDAAPVTGPVTENLPPTHAPGEYSQYGHVVDLVHSEPEGPEAGGGFIKDPLRRTEKVATAPGRSGAPTARPTRTQYVSVVLSQAELRPGGTIRIVLDLQVEP
jgi:mutual gliding-motility protein MglA